MTSQLVLNSNTVFVSLNGVDVSAYFTSEISREVGKNTQDVTHGSGQEWEQYKYGLSNYSLSLSLVYKTDTFQTVVRPVLNTLWSQAVTLIYGPEGQVIGKPKDEVLVLTESFSGPSKTIEKDMVVVELSLVGADTPTSIIETGGVFS